MASSQQNLLPPPTAIDDTHKVYSIAIACIVLGVVTSFIVLSRLGVRIKARAFGADDWAMIPALLLYIGWTAMAAYVNLHAGVGKPLWEITGIIGSAWLYPTMTATIRISILLFYYRIFAVPGARLNLLIKIILGLQFIYLVIYSILPAFICRPLYMAWHPLERQLYFNDWYYYHIQVALYSTSMSFDIILLFLPLYPVWQLQMPLKRRASIVRKLRLQCEMSTLIPPQFDTYGRTFWIPSQVEPTVALIGTSLPAIRQSLASAAQHLSEIWSQVSMSSALHTKQGSNVGGSFVQMTSRRSRVLNVVEQNIMKNSNDSEVALHPEHHELSRGSDGAM
ncbi:MAG: hypothetical protein ASARMPRED_007095 [Alectoria sarmentosa]|nr:MAG: hypothetical protein ASARMPRED_007095 [Alectoria sarmentosa]